MYMTEGQARFLVVCGYVGFVVICVASLAAVIGVGYLLYQGVMAVLA